MSSTTAKLKVLQSLALDSRDKVMPITCNKAYRLELGLGRFTVVIWRGARSDYQSVIYISTLSQEV